MRTTDNNLGNCIVADPADYHNLSQIANKKISKIRLQDRSNLLVFPSRWGELNDKVEEASIFSLQQDNRLTTFNTMGFVGLNETQLTISSRFAPQKGGDYFLHFMLQKVFGINVFNLDQTPDKESIWDFMLYLFPYFLKKAIYQGIYKEYKRKAFNDPNAKGAINIKRHIQLNRPFTGNIAYSNRVHSYDNKVTQLIRHTIEFIKKHKLSKNVLWNDIDTIAAVNKILCATAGYRLNDREKIIRENQRPFHHPYYLEYERLIRLCLQILRYEKLTFGREKDRIYGILFDGAWLWEEYLSTILNKFEFTHPENKKATNGIKLFSNNRKTIYPDFYSIKKDTVIDAKYKTLQRHDLGREDLYQMMTYMYRLKLDTGIILYPFQDEGNLHRQEQLLMHPESYGGKDASIIKYGFPIPQKTKNYEDFKKQMKNEEKQLIRNQITKKRQH